MSSKLVREELKLQEWQLYISGIPMHRIGKQLNMHYRQVWRDIHSMMNQIGKETLSMKGIEYLSKWMSNQDFRIRRLMNKLGNENIKHTEEMDVLKALQTEEELAIKKGQTLGLLTGENINFINKTEITNSLSIFQLLEISAKAKEIRNERQRNNPELANQ